MLFGLESKNETRDGQFYATKNIKKRNGRVDFTIKIFKKNEKHASFFFFFFSPTTKFR